MTVTAKFVPVQVHEEESPSDLIDKRIAGYWGSPRIDEDAAWWMGMANLVAADPCSQALYLMHVAPESFAGLPDEQTPFPIIRAWAYRVAVEFAGSKGSKQRARSLVERYRADWGRQAARDGAAIALWGHEEIPGIVARSERFKCGKQAYQRVRDAVQNRATDLIGDYRVSLRWAKGEIHSGDHVDRWEMATGKKWRDAA